MHFEQELQGEFVPDPLADLAIEYHALTEAYDRRICTGPIVNGGIMPATGYERILISANARTVRARLSKQAAERGFSEAEFQRAIIRHCPR